MGGLWTWNPEKSWGVKLSIFYSTKDGFQIAGAADFSYVYVAVPTTEHASPGGFGTPTDFWGNPVKPQTPPPQQPKPPTTPNPPLPPPEPPANPTPEPITAWGQSAWTVNQPGQNNADVPGFGIQPHGFGDAESTAAVRNLYNTLKRMTLPGGGQTEVSKQIVVIEKSQYPTNIFGTNALLKNGYMGDGDVLINPREVYSVSYFDKRSKTTYDANVYSEPLSRLAHELTHLFYFLKNGYSSSHSVQEEFEATRVENQILNRIGFPMRTHYGEHAIPNYDQYIPKYNDADGSGD
jgi:hypothetical protein